MIFQVKEFLWGINFVEGDWEKTKSCTDLWEWDERQNSGIDHLAAWHMTSMKMKYLDHYTMEYIPWRAIQSKDAVFYSASELLRTAWGNNSMLMHAAQIKPRYYTFSITILKLAYSWQQKSLQGGNWRGWKHVSIHRIVSREEVSNSVMSQCSFKNFVVCLYSWITLVETELPRKRETFPDEFW